MNLMDEGQCGLDFMNLGWENKVPQLQAEINYAESLKDLSWAITTANDTI